MARDITETYKLNEQKRILATYNEALQNVTDLSNLVDELIRIGKEELKADACSLFLYDYSSGRLQLLNIDSARPLLVEHIKEMKLDECVSLYAVESGEPFVAETIEEFPEGRLKPVLKAADINEIVSIPIKQEGRVVGVYNLAYRDALHYRKDDRSFFILLMDNINRVFQRIWHYEELKKHSERLSRIIEIVNTINRTERYEEVLDRLTQSVKGILHSHISGVMLFDRNTSELYIASIKGVEAPIEREMPRIPVNAFNVNVSRKENSFSSINIFRDERWSPLYSIARVYGFKSFYARALFSRKGQRIGILFSLWRDEYLPSLEDIVYFDIFSEYAEIALEKALLQSEIEKEKSYWVNTFNSFSDPIFITDREFNVLKYNNAFLDFLGGKNNIVGKKCYELVHGSQRPISDCPHYETILHNRTAVREFYHKETKRHFVYTTSLIKGSEEVYGLVHHIKDVSFLKRLEDERDRLLHQLVQAQKMEAVGNLAGGIAHDFNNILTGILGHAELAEMKLKDDSIRENLSVIKKAAERAKDFTKQLLLFGRKSPLEKKVQDLNSIVKESLKLINRLIGEDIELEFIPHEEPLYVDVDAAQITQVIMNLAVNARDAMPDGGRLTIKTERKDNNRINERTGRYALIVVEDTGVGIPENIKDRIFEPFFTTKPEGRGTGLGLSVVYSVVDRHGGYIDLRSSPDKGTTFEIYLPEVDMEVRYSIQMRDDEDILGGDESILLVDDEEIIRDTGRIILESLGYRVTTATNGKEALEIFKNSEDGFDLVLSDLIMPEMRGTELYRELYRIRPDVKFILITGYGRHQINSDVKYRIRAVIEKPFNIKEVAYRIRDVLDGRI
jgi:PAS domain S-box-containing protein